MLASQTSIALIEYLALPLGVLVVVAVVRAVTQTMKNHQIEASDIRSTNERLYGKAANPRTGEPAVKGWTAHVDETLDAHGAGIAKVDSNVEKLLKETRRNAELAREEVAIHVQERKRLGHDDD